ncbi:hypothetical protein Lal_00026689 [Lupinus albus]|nr:hypothetical protein Lal_00026689 [Lupinus albus]
MEEYINKYASIKDTITNSKHAQKYFLRKATEKKRKSIHDHDNNNMIIMMEPNHNHAAMIPIEAQELVMQHAAINAEPMNNLPQQIASHGQICFLHHQAATKKSSIHDNNNIIMEPDHNHAAMVPIAPQELPHAEATNAEPVNSLDQELDDFDLNNIVWDAEPELQQMGGEYETEFMNFLEALPDIGLTQYFPSDSPTQHFINHNNNKNDL